jgi:hypothetical protein
MFAYKLFSPALSPYMLLLTACPRKLGRVGRGGRGGRSAKPAAEFTRVRGRSGRRGKLARGLPVDDFRAGRSRGGRGGSPRTPSLGSFVGVSLGSRGGLFLAAFLSGLRRRELAVDLMRICLGVSRDLALRSASSSVTYSNESGTRMVDWGYSFFYAQSGYLLAQR